MKTSVRDAFVDFTSNFEGVVSWMYLDVKGLVTVAIGNLIDPVEAAIGLPFVHKGTTDAATREEIAAEWEIVKTDPKAAKRGYAGLEKVTQLRLTAEGVEKVVLDRLALNESILRKRFPDWDHWPADAQLATHSMAWACGPAFHFDALAHALSVSDFAMAANTCHINDRGNPGLTPRNAANRRLYELAARTMKEGRNTEELFYFESGQDLPPTEIIHPEVPLDEPPQPADV